MPKAASSNSNQGPSFQPKRPQARWLSASITFVLGMLLTVSFLDYSPDQVPLNHPNTRVENAVGLFGVYSTYWSIWWLGVSAWFIPSFLFWMTYVSLRNVRQLIVARGLSMIVCIVSGAGLAAMIGGFEKSDYFATNLGGLVGRGVYNGFLAELMGGFGSAVLLGLLYVLSLIFILTSDIGAEFDRALHAFHEWRASRKELKNEEARLRAELRAAEEKSKKEIGRAHV